MSRRTIGGVVWVALVLGGCVRSPEAVVESVSLTDMTDQGVRTEVVVKLTNPNAVALPLKLSDYQIKLDGIGSYASDEHPNATVPAGGSQRFVIPAAFVQPAGGRVGAEAGYELSGSVEYQPPGKFEQFLTDLGFPLPSVDFAGKGTATGSAMSLPVKAP